MGQSFGRLLSDPSRHQDKPAEPFAGCGPHSPLIMTRPAPVPRNELKPVAQTYIVAPNTHGANSAAPKSKASLLVCSPEATLSINSNTRAPHSWTVSSPS